MKKRNFLFCIFMSIVVFGMSQNRPLTEQNVKVKPAKAPFKKNILSVSVGAGKYGPEIFENTFSVGLTTHTFKYTRRFSPRFGLSIYRTGSRTKDILNLNIKSKHTGIAFRFTSSAARPLQFYFAPSIGVGKYPGYTTDYIDAFGSYKSNGPLTFDQNWMKLDIGGELGFEYHFANSFLVSLSSQTYVNIDSEWQYSISAGFGLKF